jgi:hypothetical protein
MKLRVSKILIFVGDTNVYVIVANNRLDMDILQNDFKILLIGVQNGYG